MGVLNGYFDDSGCVTGPNVSSFAIVGYVAPCSIWTAFEDDWREMLKAHAVPYLHMKEFYPSANNELSRLSETEKAALLSTAAKVIGKHGLYGVGALVRVPDVEKFNKETGRGIDARALALYGCMHELYSKYQGQGIEIRVDRFDKPCLVVETACEYAKTYKYDDISQNLKIMATRSEMGSFKDILPMQAADFAAYESRKFHEDDREWFSNEKPNLEPSEWQGSHKLWRIKRKGAWPSYRKSFSALLDASPMNGGVWDYQLLCALDFYNLKSGVWSVPRFDPFVAGTIA